LLNPQNDGIGYILESNTMLVIQETQRQIDNIISDIEVSTNTIQEQVNKVSNESNRFLRSIMQDNLVCEQAYRKSLSIELTYLRGTIAPPIEIPIDSYIVYNTYGQYEIKEKV